MWLGQELIRYEPISVDITEISFLGRRGSGVQIAPPRPNDSIGYMDAIHRAIPCTELCTAKGQGRRLFCVERA